MKIAYVYDQLLKCGGTRVAFEHCRELKRLGHEATIFANWWDPGMIDWFDRYMIRPRLLQDYQTQDVVISCWWRQMDQVKLLPATHHFQFVQGRDKLSYSAGHAWHDEIDAAMHRLDFEYLAVSAWAGDSCRNPKIIPNGVDSNFWRPAAFMRMATPFTILLEASSMDAYKGIAEGLEVVARIKRDNPKRKIQCWLVTKNAFANDVIDRTILDPNDVQISHAYQNADVLLKTTWFDGFGLPHLEAMASALPLVTTNAGGNMDFCHHETNCLVTKPQDIDAMTVAIQRVMDDPALRDRLKANGMLTAKRWTWGRSIERLLEAING